MRANACRMAGPKRSFNIVLHSAMKKLPRRGGHRSGKQDWRNPRFSGELVILYEDDAVVALDKPAGLPEKKDDKTPPPDPNAKPQ